MARKLLVPVFPSDRFYDAVVAAADLLAEEGGLLTFLFTEVRPVPEAYAAADEDGHPSALSVAVNSGEVDGADLDAWRQAQVSGLDEARQILYQRGIRDAQIDYGFADFADDESPGQAIADEAAAGAYDLVVLARGYLEDGVDEQGDDAHDVFDALEHAGEEVHLLVV